MLKKRVITSLYAIPLLIILIWFDKPLPWFTLFIALWGALAAFEFYRMVAGSKAPPLTYFGIIWTLLFILSPHFDYGFLPLLLFASAVILSPILLILRPRKESFFASWVWTMAGILYVGWLLSYLVALRLEVGRSWVFLAIFTTFGSDMAAFFVGRALGKHRLAPRISPGKTWEGAVAGVFGAIIASLIVVAVFSMPLSFGQAILLGLLVSIFGQIGDLLESLFKRNMGVKESGKLLPGHGGLLDRMDSVVFAGIVVYLFYIIVVL